MSIHLSSQSSQPNPGPSLPAARPGALAAPAAIRSRSALGSGRPCPFLGSQDGAGLANGSPSRVNVCYGQPRTMWQGFRRVQLPYSRVTKEKQSEICFAAFNQCPHHQRASEAQEEHKRHLQEGQRPPHGHDAPGDGAHKPMKRHHPAGRSAKPMSSRMKAALMYGGLGLGAMLGAFIVTFVISSEPSRMFDFVLDHLVLQDVKAFGVGDKGADKSLVSGVVTGGDLRAEQLKSMSEADKDKLKNSAMFKNMSEADKAKLKEKYKAMMGR